MWRSRRSQRDVVRRDRGVRPSGDGRRGRTLVALGVCAVLLTGCSIRSAGPPEVTFYGDGKAVNAKPLLHCDVLVRTCDKYPDAAVTLRVRPGYPVNISVPSEVKDTPWLVNVQYADQKGNVKLKQKYFSPGSRLSYTATGDNPADQLAVVEVQQLGAAYAADQGGNPILDENGNPQLVARAYWSLQVQP